MKKILTSVLFLLSISLYGQEKKTSDFISIEVDPAAYILKGYSVSIKYSPAKLGRLAIMGSIYKSDFPDGMMMQENKDLGWTNLKIETSYALFSELYLRENRTGLYFGPSVFFYNKNVTNNELDESTSFSTVYPNIRIGYVWTFCKSDKLYLSPWLNVGSEINVDDNNQVQGIEFKPNSFNYIIALHVGYRIN